MHSRSSVDATPGPPHAAPRPGRIPAAALADHDAMLLAVARELFYEAGYEGTSIETIARAARVSPKTIYARYGGKPGLFVAALRERAEAVLSVLREPIASGVDVRTALTEFAVRLLTLTTSAEALTIQRVVFSEAHRFPELGRAFYENGPKRGVDALAQFFARAANAGLIAVDDPQFAAEYFAGSVVGMPVRMALSLGDLPDAEAIRRRADAGVAAFLRAFSVS